jgi:VanZ family protein
MNLSRVTIIGFRLIFVVSLLLITVLTTMKLPHSVMTAVNDKLGHFLAFFYLAFVLDFSFPKSSFNLLKILPLLVYGLIIEIVQYHLPYRTFSLLDLLADGGGIVIYVLIIPLLRHVPVLKLRWTVKAETRPTS